MPDEIEFLVCVRVQRNLPKIRILGTFGREPPFLVHFGTLYFKTSMKSRRRQFFEVKNVPRKTYRTKNFMYDGICPAHRVGCKPRIQFHPA